MIIFHCIDPLASSACRCKQKNFACRLNFSNSYYDSSAFLATSDAEVESDISVVTLVAFNYAQFWGMHRSAKISAQHCLFQLF